MPVTRSFNVAIRHLLTPELDLPAPSSQVSRPLQFTSCHRAPHRSRSRRPYRRGPPPPPPPPTISSSPPPPPPRGRRGGAKFIKWVGGGGGGGGTAPNSPTHTSSF